MKSHKFRLYPTKEQTNKLELSIDICRRTYNHILSELSNRFTRNKPRNGLFVLRYINKVLILLFLSLLLVSLVIAGPSVKLELIGNNPIYQEAQVKPSIFMSKLGGRIIEDDMVGGIFNDNGNVTQRTNNYIFTGESITWEVLVLDINGVNSHIKSIYSGWGNVSQFNPENQASCEYITNLIDGDLLSPKYSNVRVEGETQDQLTFNKAIMGEYKCKLIIEPECKGKNWFGVKVIDNKDLSDTINEVESWFCNPNLNLELTGDINFGTLSPGQIKSSTFTIKNKIDDGSGVEVVPSILGTDFYDPSSNPVNCPDSNVLKLQGDQDMFNYGFWYEAVQGSAKTYGKKRIPYGDSIEDSDPILSKSTKLNNWREWVLSDYFPITPGSEITITLSLGLPIKCNGQFTQGNIDAYLWAV